MAPDQLSNENLISILWNKIPMKLQKEVREIIASLFRAEARVAERECRNTQSGPKRRVYYGKKHAETSTNKKIETQERTQAKYSKKKSEHPFGKSSVDGEMKNESIKCYKCHIARLCPEFCMINLDSSTGPPNGKSTDPLVIPRIRVLRVSDTTFKGEEKGVKLSGPTYNIDIKVVGVKT